MRKADRSKDLTSSGRAARFTDMRSPYQLQFRFEDHPNGADYWQPGRVFGSLDRALVENQKNLDNSDLLDSRVIDRQTGEVVS